jgi:hypothetical protein
MFLKEQRDGTLVEILSLSDLYDPFQREVEGRIHAGQEMQDPEMFSKTDLIFPSGESLPRCWLDSHYREHITEMSGAASA